jgi:hypothetical protein
MKTEELIELISFQVEPVKATHLRRTLWLSLAVGIGVTVCLMLALFGVPAYAFGAGDLRLQAVSFSFTLGLVAIGAHFLVTLARPGEPGRKALLLMGLVFLVLLSAGLIALTLSPRAAWHAMLFSPQWSMCLICIPLFALAPFAALIWALRRAAPTHPALTGATAGMIAVASGAAIFSCCIPGSSLPFVTVWYGGVILLCALAGAVISPWFLRW